MLLSTILVFLWRVFCFIGRHLSSLFRSRLWAHISETLRLATPVAVSRLGQWTIVAVDTAMVGRHGIDDLSLLSLAFIPVSLCLLIGIGLGMGVLLMTARYFGASNYTECGATWRRGLVYAFWIGMGGAAVCFASGWFLLVLGQDPQLVAAATPIAIVYGWTLPILLMSVASSYFLEAIKRPLLSASIIVLSNVVNIALNSLLIYGDNLGDAAMGAVIATLITRLFQFICLVGLIWFVIDHRLFAVRRRAMGGWSAWREQRRFGYAGGVSLGFEHIAFSLLIVFAGWLAIPALAAFYSVYMIFTLIFMLSIGIGAATAVRVSIAVGNSDLHAARTAAWSGFGLCLIINVVVGIFLLMKAEWVVRLINNDNTIFILYTQPLVVLAAYALIFDGGQAVLAHILRSFQYPWTPAIIQLCAYSMVMVPGAWWMAFALEWEAWGLVASILLGTAVAMIAMLERLYRQKLVAG